MPLLFLLKAHIGIRSVGWGCEKGRVRCGIILGEGKAQNTLNDVSACAQNTLSSPQCRPSFSDIEACLGRRLRAESRKTDCSFQSCLCLLLSGSLRQGRVFSKPQFSLQSEDPNTNSQSCWEDYMRSSISRAWTWAWRPVGPLQMVAVIIII